MLSSISIVSPRVLPIFIDFRIIPVLVYNEISHSHSAMIDIASSGRVSISSHFIVEVGVNNIEALLPI
jgi:hypothetical protein